MSFSLTQAAITLIDNTGYTGLSLGLILDSAGIPIPSEALIPLAVAASKTGRFNLVAVIVIGVVAQVIGGIIAYEIGRRGGLPLLSRYGKYFLISQRDLEFTHAQFMKRGTLLAGVGRCLPLIRGYVGFVAGIANMPFKTFVIATTIGSAAWTAILVGLGFLLADNLEEIDKVGHSAGIIIGIIILFAIVYWIQHRITRKPS